jgi:hypothetical protein
MPTVEPVTNVNWKDEGPGGPVWLGTVNRDVQIVGHLDGPIWYTHEQAMALSQALAQAQLSKVTFTES